LYKQANCLGGFFIFLFIYIRFYLQERAQELLVGFVDHLDTAELEETSGRVSYENSGTSPKSG
jgi:hypothetical protein